MTGANAPRRLFISHSSEDNELTSQISDLLEAPGIEVLLDLTDLENAAVGRRHHDVFVAGDETRRVAEETGDEDREAHQDEADHGLARKTGQPGQRQR